MIPRLFHALIFVATIGLLPAFGDEWISDRYRCSLTFSNTESWLPGSRQSLPLGEIAYHARFAQNHEGIIVIVAPDPPTSDMSNPAFVKSIGDVLTSVGFTVEKYEPLTWLDLPSGQFIARRRDAVFGATVGVARATVRDRKLYIVMAYGKGEADRADDKHFTRVIDTFRLLEGSATRTVIKFEVPPSRYRLGAVVCVAAAAFVAAMFCAVMFITRPKAEEEA